MTEAQVGELLEAIALESGGALSFTGNPHHAAFLIDFNVSYPLRGTYFTQEGSRIKGYNCKPTLSAYSMVKHKKVAGMTMSCKLESEIDVYYDATKVWAEMPDFSGSEELAAFMEKLLLFASKN